MHVMDIFIEFVALQLYSMYLTGILCDTASEVKGNDAWFSTLFENKNVNCAAWTW